MSNNGLKQRWLILQHLLATKTINPTRNWRASSRNMDDVGESQFTKHPKLVCTCGTARAFPFLGYYKFPPGRERSPWKKKGFLPGHCSPLLPFSGQSRTPENPFRKRKARRIALTLVSSFPSAFSGEKMPTYKIRGIDVDFPFEAYDCQIVYMEKVIRSLQEVRSFSFPHLHPQLFVRWFLSLQVSLSLIALFFCFSCYVIELIWNSFWFSAWFRSVFGFFSSGRNVWDL